MDEAAKCELLCSTCHALEEATRAVAAYRALPERPGDTARPCSRHGLQPHHLSEGRWRCRTCRSERVIAWYRRRKAYLVECLGGRCERCKAPVPVVAFQFHHRDRATKAFSLSGPGLFRSLPIVLEELAKCELVCANCHAELEATLSSRAGGG